jgi:HD-GYP domain-containing protein (c-di-GMP phosphodiesterase class II)
MPSKSRKVSLIFFVIVTLLLVGLVPLVLSGWLLSEKSGRELRSAESRYQIQLVQEKAKQIEIFAQRYGSVVSGLASALELGGTPHLLTSEQTEKRLGQLLRDNPELLALYLKPAGGEAVAIFRSEHLSRSEVDAIAADAQNFGGKSKVRVGQARGLQKPGTFVMPFAADVSIGGQTAASIVAVTSLKSVTEAVVGVGSAREEELWKAGLPIVFAVDPAGNTLFHPDAALTSDRRPMRDLRIVQEWLESGQKIQSALVPFTATYNGKSTEMIGAYSTAHLADGYNVGVIAMQDESRALASVGEMRTQAWLISLGFAVLALFVGFVGSRFMTAPLLRMVGAAKRIASGDFSQRVETNSMTEIGVLGETFNLMTDRVEEQIGKLAKAAEENRELFVGTVKALAAAIDGKDKYTRGHSERVSRISVAIGRRLGMDAEELEKLRISALLHDVGKIAIDDAILKKPAALTDEEFAIMKTHPMRGYKIMSQIPAMKDFLPGMVMHHEMVNGMGYPHGLTGDQIPLQAKIVSVADTFDAMTIDRPYSKGMELPAALERLRSFVGTRYESAVVEALVEACNAGEVANGIVRQMAAIRAAAAEEISPAGEKMVA